MAHLFHPPADFLIGHGLQQRRRTCLSSARGPPPLTETSFTQPFSHDAGLISHTFAHLLTGAVESNELWFLVNFATDDD